MLTPTYSKELELLDSYHLIAGLDEAGRGPLAGPVVAGVVILNPATIGKNRTKRKWWYEIRDSKLLSEKKRSNLIDLIKQNSLDFSVGLATHEEIDDLNIHNASLLAMTRAVKNLKTKPEIVLIDGKSQIYKLGIEQEPIINGDARILSIAAASILAKTHRDDLMWEYSRQYKHFGFEKHKGYDTQFHRKRLIQHGPCEIHRMTFATVKDIMNQRFKVG
jgi:ribonuclease HII